MRRLMLLGCALLLASCAGVHHELAEERGPGLAPGMGVVLLSLAHPEDLDQFPPTCKYRGPGGVEGETPEMTSYRAGLDKAIFRVPERGGGRDPGDWKMWGRVTVMELPAGEYEFHKCEVRSGDGRWRYVSTEAFSIRFAVAPGKTRYLGSLQLAFRDKRVDYAVQDRRARDLEVARAKWPWLGLAPIEVEPMRKGAGGPGR